MIAIFFALAMIGLHIYTKRHEIKEINHDEKKIIDSLYMLDKYSDQELVVIDSNDDNLKTIARLVNEINITDSILSPDTIYEGNNFFNELAKLIRKGQIFDFALVKVTNEELFYMIKEEGTFDKMQVRSELPQNQPYKPLAEVLKTDQTVFDYDNVKGTIVGLYCPNYMDKLNAVGWHFHFISDDKKKGGHVLELSLKNATVYLDQTDRFTMLLHEDKEFHELNLAKDMRADIQSAEQDTKGKLASK